MAFFRNPGLFIILAVLLLYSVIAHEIAHGWVAYLFGDDTSKRYGRLVLIGMSLELIGTLMLFFVGFGWAKPDRLTIIRQILVWINRCFFGWLFTNIVIAIIAMLLLQLQSISTNPAFSTLLSIVVRINIILGAFNLIPIPPLDGSKISYESSPGGCATGTCEA